MIDSYKVFALDFPPHIEHNSLMNRRTVMDHTEMDKLEWEVKRLEKMSLILAEQLNEKIDENTELKSEVARLNNLILSIDV